MRYGLRCYWRELATGAPSATGEGAQTYLLLHFPHALHTAEHVAAPQHEAANVAT
jgi:hypothetical protein